MSTYCDYVVDEYGMAKLTIDNPPMNTLNTKVMKEMTNTVLRALADTSVRVIILTGKGKAFVAGADISEIQDIDSYQQGMEFSHNGYMLMDTIEQAHKPIIAVINGFCLGGGLELAMSCHMRIASDKVRIGLPEITLGVIPGFAGTQRLPRIVGKAKALEMILTGAHYSAQDALAIGLVNRVVPDESLMEEAVALAHSISSKSRISVRAAMDAVAGGLEISFEEGLEIEAGNFARVAISSDAKEGLDAFLNKRKPEFKDM